MKRSILILFCVFSTRVKIQVLLVILLLTGNVTFAQNKESKIYTVTVKDDGSVEHRDGRIHYDNDEFTQALPLFEKSAQKGNPNGMFMLGSMYNFGKGVTQNYSKAMEWYLKAAEKNQDVAMFNIAAMYMNGEGVAQNVAKAMEWAEKAASHGHVQSMLNLSIDAYEKQNFEKMFFWMHKAAEAGNAEAMNNVADMYIKGAGTTKDEVKANEWYHKAAEAGNFLSIRHVAWAAYDKEDYKTSLNWFLKAVEGGDAESMAIAGTFYASGLGTEKNMNEAYKLWLKAAELNQPSAMYNIGGLYDDGLLTGTKADAAAWYKKAASLGHEDAAKRLKELGY